MNYKDKFGIPMSVNPPTKYLTFGCWIYMVPQYKPKNILMLGYCGGTTAGLIRLLYGNVPITAVDVDFYDNLYDVEFVKADAREYVKTCRNYDAVIVDLYPKDSPHPCDFITSKEFVDNLGRISNYLIVNTSNNLDMSNYKFECLTWITPPSLTNKIYYFKVKDVPNLFIFK